MGVRDDDEESAERQVPAEAGDIIDVGSEFAGVIL